MDYKEKYKEALERCKKEFNFNNLAYSHEEIKQRLERVFPELKESEDEKIRKYLIDVVNDYCKGSEHDGCIAWLEKQGEQKPVDKVEPKFNVGDWITNNKLLVGQVTSFDGEYYHYMRKGIEHLLHISNTYNWHLWTIEDAKDGDVLTDGDLPFIFKKIDAYNYTYAYCGISLSGNFRIDSDGELGEWTWMLDIKPATKEQRELLFQKMKEAGYEWDAEKKELKKIEHKFAWSEEDEKFFKTAIWHLSHSISDGKSTDIHSDTTAWLKTLKQRMKGDKML